MIGQIKAITDYETAYKLYSLWLFIFYKIIYFQSYMSFKMTVLMQDILNMGKYIQVLCC